MALTTGVEQRGDAGASSGGGGGALALRLYIAGDAPNSCEARANLEVILQQHGGDLPGGYELEVVDFLQEPQRALRDGVIVTPTLVKLAPQPSRRIIGTLRETAQVLTALGLRGGRRA